MQEMYIILAVTGWSWCGLFFLYLAFKLRRLPRGASSDDASRVEE